MSEQYVGYSPWTDAARYGQGLGQSLGQAFTQMPAQRLQMAMGLAQQQQRQQALAAQLSIAKLRAQQEEGLRNAQLQEALARTTTAQAQLGKATQQKHEFFKDKNGFPIGYFDYSAGKFVPITGGAGGGLGATNPPVASPAVTSSENRAGASALGDLTRIIGAGAGGSGIMTNAPSVYSQATNAFPQLLQAILQKNGQQPQLGAPTNMPPQVASPATNNIGRFQISEVQ